MAGRVLLKNVTSDAEGTYKCEVSTEAPVFDTDYKEANLTVVGDDLTFVLTFTSIYTEYRLLLVCVGYLLRHVFTVECTRKWNVSASVGINRITYIPIKLYKVKERN